MEGRQRQGAGVGVDRVGDAAARNFARCKNRRQDERLGANSSLAVIVPVFLSPSCSLTLKISGSDRLEGSRPRWPQ